MSGVQPFHPLKFLRGVVPWGFLRILPQDAKQGKRQRLVILGTGWGAMSLLQHISTEKYQLAVVSPTNYFLFTPFLPSSTTGTIEPSHCIEPVRRVLRRYNKKADFFEAAAEDVDFEKNMVMCIDPSKSHDDPSRSFELAYDHLVIAIGADNNTFNTAGVADHACFLKTLDDARIIKTKILKNFEQAALPCTSIEEKKQLLHFVIVGGGPTGVEFAAELHDYVHNDLSQYFATNCKDYVKITIIEGTDHVLNAFDREIAKYAEEKFRRNGVELITKTLVTGLTAKTIELMDAKTKQKVTQPQGLVVWATGITTRPCVKRFMSRLPHAQQHARALSVDEHLTVKGCNNVYAIGDCCTIKYEQLETTLEKLWDTAAVDGKWLSLESFRKFVNDNRQKHVQLEFMADQAELYFHEHDKDHNQKLDKEEFTSLLKEIDSKITSLPATAQVAAQQGAYLAQRLNRMDDPDFALKPFAYNHRGNFAYVGDNEVVYSSDLINLKGGAAFWGRNAAYLSKLFSWESKRNIAWDLFWSKWFGRDISHT